MTAYYMSFDVEDWFHASNLWHGLDRAKWDEYELRVVENTQRILNLLDEHDVRATFFVLGHVAERAPGLVESIHDRGHEVASHGYNHRLLSEQPPAAVRKDVRRSIDLIESITGEPVQGYRAPCFSITDAALDELASLGLRYDSSQFPVEAQDRYGSVATDEPDETFTTTESGMIEVQLPQFDAFGIQVPWAGGGYFRFIPYPIYRRGIRRITAERDFVFYFHPWELDPDQPRVSGIPRQYRIRHYTNLHRTESRLDRLLSDFDWEPIGAGVDRQFGAQPQRREEPSP
jgi:polysaccharide deacetylase family protein (PEP-CTERM system associated)